MNLSEKDIRGLEQTDEILLSKILECDANTSNVLKYLELGVYPLKFEIMKRKIIFLQYILKQEQNSMINKVFKATCEHPLRNDFVQTCQKYLKTLNIDLSFEQIRNMHSKHKRWKYEDTLCVGCKENSESENELLSCPGFSESNEEINKEISYSLVFGDKASEMIKVAKVIRKKLKVREKLMENGKKAKEASLANGPCAQTDNLMT